MNQLSVRQSFSGNLPKYIFAHDIYLYDCESFKKFNYTNYCDNLELLYGIPQSMIEINKLEQEILSVQIIFDFVSSRLAQFYNFLASGRLGLRGVLLRVSSIKHSNILLKNLGIEDRELGNFVEKVMNVRKSPNSYSEQMVAELFIESFYHFSRVLHLAASYFAENYLNFHSVIDDSNTLKINSQFLIRFVEETPEFYRNLRNEQIVYYPKEIFYHYLAYTEYNNLLGVKAKYLLSCSGDESYELYLKYKSVLKRRLDAMSDHLIFLKKNRAYYAMKGYPGFIVDWESINIPKKQIVDWESINIPKKQKESSTTFKFYTDRPSSQPKLNIIIDKVINVEPFETIKKHFDFDINQLELEKSEYEHWVLHFFPDWGKRYGHLYHKKLIELYVTYFILDPVNDDTYMDVAGGFNTYIDKINCMRKYIQSIIISNELKTFFGSEILYIQSDAAKIPVPEESLSKMFLSPFF